MPVIEFVRLTGERPSDCCLCFIVACESLTARNFFSGPRSPSDFHVFSLLKKFLAGQQFACNSQDSSLMVVPQSAERILAQVHIKFSTAMEQMSAQVWGLCGKTV